MTLPCEEKRALKNAYQFLCDLLTAKETPKVPKRIRQMASRILKHYPVNYRIDELYETGEK